MEADFRKPMSDFNAEVEAQVVKFRARLNKVFHAQEVHRTWRAGIEGRMAGLMENDFPGGRG